MPTELPPVKVNSVEELYKVMASSVMFDALKKIELLAADKLSVECQLQEIVTIAKMAMLAAGSDGKS